MKIINAYVKGFKEALRLKNIITIIYAVTLLLALSVVIPYKVIVTNNLEHRPQVYKLMGDFDFTVIADLLNNKGDLIYPFITILFWFSIFYFFFAVFFTGGVLKLVNEKNDKPTGKIFFSGCAKYFFPFLRLAIYILLIQIAIAVLIALVFGIVLSILDDPSEQMQFYIPLTWAIIQLLIFWFVIIVSDYAKIILVKEDSKKVWRAIGTGFAFSIRKISRVYPLYLLLILVPVLLTLFYLWIDSVIGMTTGFTILILFIIQQMMIWFRFFAKAWLIGSEYEFFDEHYSAITQPLQTQEIILDENL